MPQSSIRAGRWAVSGVAAALIAITAWNLYQSFRGEDAGPAAVATPLLTDAAPGSPLAESPGPTPTLPEGLPGLEESDALVRQLAAALSSHPALAQWLATEGLIRRFVAVVDNLAEGKSPRQHLAFLDPKQEFSVARKGERVFVDPRSYRRYDLAADVLTSLDTQGTADLYRRLQPLMEQAYRDLGNPDRDFDRRLALAVQKLLETPVIDERVELDQRVTTHEFRDSKLQELSPAKRHFLRMGPRNVERVQAKLHEITTALGLALPPA